MLHRRRQDIDHDSSSPQAAAAAAAAGSGRKSPQPPVASMASRSGPGHAATPSQAAIAMQQLLRGTNPDGSLKNKTSRRRVLFIVSPIALFLFFLLSSSPDPNTSSSYGRGRALPGFASRSGYASSRRTDALVRQARKNRAQATISHGGTGGYGPANFSEPPPFTFCPTFGPSDELGNVYGAEAIMKTRAHVGSSERIRKVIKRAMAGLPITIGVLGGSVSSCHGLDTTQAHPLGNPIGPNCYPHRLFSWLNDVFPHPANELTNGACEFGAGSARGRSFQLTAVLQCDGRELPTLASAPTCICLTESISSLSNSTRRILSTCAPNLL